MAPLNNICDEEKLLFAVLMLGHNLWAPFLRKKICEVEIIYVGPKKLESSQKDQTRRQYYNTLRY